MGSINPPFVVFGYDSLIFKERTDVITSGVPRTPSSEAYLLHSLIQRSSYHFILVSSLATHTVANLQVWEMFISTSCIQTLSGKSLVPSFGHQAQRIDPRPAMDGRTPHLTSIRSLIHHCPECSSDVERGVNTSVNCSDNRSYP
jgi:hypothetical protein